MTDEAMSHSEDTCFVSVYFTGHVQGVGFRYQTVQVAKGFEVTGYVKNLADGRVQLEVEGAEKEVESFVTELEDQLATYIRHAEKRGGRRKQTFFDFTIR